VQRKRWKEMSSLGQQMAPNSTGCDLRSHKAFSTRLVVARLNEAPSLGSWAVTHYPAADMPRQ